MYIFHDLKQKLVVYLPKRYSFGNMDLIILSIKTLNFQKQIFHQKFPTSPQWLAAFPPLFPIFSAWFPALLPPIPPILLTLFPDYQFWRLQMATENDILTSLKTLSTSWRSSHRSVWQRKQFFRIAVLQSIKLSGFSISSKNVPEGVQF